MKHKILLGSLLIFTFLIRCAHLIWQTHYPIVNPDSFYFMLLARQSPSLLHNGLAPLLHYTGMWGAILIPPFIGVLTAILIYWFCAKVFSKNVGLLAIFVWATFQPAFFASLAGNVDMDSLAIFLICLALVIYYFSKTWVGALWVAIICAIIYCTWVWIGAGVIAFIITVTAITEYWQNKRFERPQVLGALAIVAILVVPFFLTNIWADFGLVLNQGSTQISEMAPVNAALLWPYFVLLLFPIAFGFKALYDCIRGLRSTGVTTEALRAYPPMLFCASWVAACLIMGLTANRLVQFMIPAVCIVAAFGFDLILKDKVILLDKKRPVIIFSVVMLLISSTFAIDLPQNITMPNKWVDACYWIRDNTPENSRIMSWWDNGYVIQDLAERPSLMDGGTNSDTNTSHFIGLVYCTQDDKYAADLMNEYGTKYVVFSTVEKHFFSTIEKAAGQSGSDGLYERSEDTDFESPNFNVVYRNSDVWILQPKCAVCGGGT